MARKSNRQVDLNPIVQFETVWKIAERISTAVAFLLVFGTVGAISAHAFI